MQTLERAPAPAAGSEGGEPPKRLDTLVGAIGPEDGAHDDLSHEPIQAEFDQEFNDMLENSNLGELEATPGLAEAPADSFDAITGNLQDVEALGNDVIAAYDATLNGDIRDVAETSRKIIGDYSEHSLTPELKPTETAASDSDTTVEDGQAAPSKTA